MRLKTGLFVQMFVHIILYTNIHTHKNGSKIAVPFFGRNEIQVMQVY